MSEGAQALLLAVRDDRYALPVAQAVGVVEPAGLTRVPESPAAVLGLLNVRGRIVPVLDLGRLLGIGPVGDVVGVAVVDTPHGAAGLASGTLPASAVLGEDLGPSTLSAGSRRHRVGDGVATLLDVPALLASLGTATE